MSSKQVSGTYKLSGMKSNPMMGNEPMNGGKVSQGKGQSAMADQNIRRPMDGGKHVGEYCAK